MLRQYRAASGAQKTKLWRQNKAELIRQGFAERDEKAATTATPGDIVAQFQALRGAEKTAFYRAHRSEIQAHAKTA